MNMTKCINLIYIYIYVYIYYTYPGYVYLLINTIGVSVISDGLFHYSIHVPSTAPRDARRRTPPLCVLPPSGSLPGVVLPYLGWWCPTWGGVALPGVVVPYLGWWCPFWGGVALPGVVLPYLGWWCPNWGGGALPGVRRRSYRRTGTGWLPGKLAPSVRRR